METGSCHGGMKAAILRIESNLKETDFFFLTEKAEEKKTCAELQMWWIPSRTPQFIEVWDVDTIQRRDSTICIWDCFYFPALTWIPLFSAQINATSCPPHHPTPKQSSPHCLSLRMCHSFPLYFRNCNHMSEGTPGSSLHLEEQHYYRQFTLKFECIRRGSNHSGRDGGRGWMERWRD